MIELRITAEDHSKFMGEVAGFFKGILPSLVQHERGFAPQRPSVEQPAEPQSVSDAPPTVKVVDVGGVLVEETKVAAPSEPPVSEAPKETKRGRKDKTEKPAADPQQVDLEDAIAEKAAAEAPEPSLDDIRSALKRLASTKGNDAVWKLLGKLKAEKASDIKDAGKGRELVAECETLLAS